MLAVAVAVAVGVMLGVWVAVAVWLGVKLGSWASVGKSKVDGGVTETGAHAPKRVNASTHANTIQPIRTVGIVMIALFFALTTPAMRWGLHPPNGRGWRVLAEFAGVVLL